MEKKDKDYKTITIYVNKETLENMNFLKNIGEKPNYSLIFQNGIENYVSSIKDDISISKGNNMGFIEIKHPLILDKLTRMRKIETSSKDFRENLNEIGQLMVYEVFRDLEITPVQIQTPITQTTGYTITKSVVLIPIMRAGMGMIDGIQKLIPTARVAHIGLYRDEKTLEAHQYFAKKTDDIPNSNVIIVDPMLATGGSAVAAIKIAKEWGAKNIKFVCLVSADKGVKRVLDEHPDVEIFSAGHDGVLLENGYISPGLGDAGDRIFGTK